MTDPRDEAREEKQKRQDMALFLGHAPGDTYSPRAPGKPRAIILGKALEQTRRYMRGK